MKTFAIILIFLIGCAGTPIDMKLNPLAVEQMDELYDPMKEKAFCVSRDKVHNILDGSMTSCPMPLCFVDDIVFHTHPFYAENGANVFDLCVWEEYHKRYGNIYFGVMYGRGKYKIYNIND